MIISKRKHESIVSMKDCDIKVLNNKLEGVKELLKARDLELYEVNQEANQLSDELEQTKLHLKDIDIALDLMIDKVEELENENEGLADTILKLREDNIELQKEINSYKQRLEKIDDLKVQYRTYIDKSVEVNAVTHIMTKEDVKKFLSNEGIEGIVKLYMIASMM